MANKCNAKKRKSLKKKGVVEVEVPVKKIMTIGESDERIESELDDSEDSVLTVFLGVIIRIKWTLILILVLFL